MPIIAAAALSPMGRRVGRRLLSGAGRKELVQKAGKTIADTARTVVNKNASVSDRAGAAARLAIAPALASGYAASGIAAYDQLHKKPKAEKKEFEAADEPTAVGQIVKYGALPAVGWIGAEKGIRRVFDKPRHAEAVQRVNANLQEVGTRNAAMSGQLKAAGQPVPSAYQRRMGSMAPKAQAAAKKASDLKAARLRRESISRGVSRATGGRVKLPTAKPWVSPKVASRLRWGVPAAALATAAGIGYARARRNAAQQPEQGFETPWVIPGLSIRRGGVLTELGS